MIHYRARENISVPIYRPGGGDACVSHLLHSWTSEKCRCQLGVEHHRHSFIYFIEYSHNCENFRLLFWYMGTDHPWSVTKKVHTPFSALLWCYFIKIELRDMKTSTPQQVFRFKLFCRRSKPQDMHISRKLWIHRISSTTLQVSLPRF